MNAFYRYWGKAKKSPDSEGADYHLLAYHCLDVAAVGWHLLTPRGKLCQRLSAELDVEPEWLQAWFCYCLMLHDLGKFFRAFQNLSPNMSDNLVAYDGNCIYAHRHDTLGFAIWNDFAKSQAEIIPRSLTKAVKPWLEIVCGHHGKPPEQLRAYKSYLLPDDELAAEAFIKEVSAQWRPSLRSLEHIKSEKLKACSWQLAGLAVLADWLGSSQAHFPYKADALPLSEYWSEYALKCASAAIADANLAPCSVNEFTSIKQQFDFISQPTPLQSYAQTVAITNDPQLFILEDVTGAGKTEAAMVLVHRLISQGLAEGVYVGLPTMATANGMYQRMVQSYRKLFAEDEWPSLVLAHGASQLSKEFNESVTLSAHQDDKNYEKGELSASAYCNAWLADTRKKALLADVGVGTIDQALLGVLPAKHQSLRLFGLANKVLLIDEVHAFDPYMQQLLCALLKAHAGQGGSVILLSATLPLAYRKTLTAAFASGLKINEPELNPGAGYPWVTQMSSQAFVETPVATRPSVARQVEVKRLDSEQSALEIIRNAARGGQCICWIRNTINDAHEALNLLAQQSDIEPANITLFHSRYAMIDRQAIEQDVLERFGKKSNRNQRAGQVLIATQVVEQSLDLDFDVMISDLAPVDLLIQRAGRLQRHTRSAAGDRHEQEQRNKPCLYVLAPDPKNVTSPNWLRELLPGTQAVYPNVGQLWLTLNVLLEHNGFAMPADARRLIEGVYGEHAQQNIPEVLEEATAVAQAQNKAEAGMGSFNVLNLDKGYCEKSAMHNAGWTDEVNIPTRLGSDTVTCVLVRKFDGQWQPYAQGLDHAWALSQISLPNKAWQQVQKLIPPDVQSELTQLKEAVAALRWLELIPLIGSLGVAYSSSNGWRSMDAP